MHSICNLKFYVPQEILIDFHNGSNYDYHFITKELPKKFEKQVTCLGEKIEKCITFSVPIEEEIKRTDKKGKEMTKTISYRLQVLIEQEWQVHYQISLIILLKEFLKLN